MTTGSWTTDARVTLGSDWIGSYSTCSWTGTDSPRSPRVAPTYYTCIRDMVDPKTGRSKAVTFRIRRPNGVPPKRARNVDHPFSKTYTRLENERVQVAGNPGVWLPSSQAFSYGSWSTEELFTANDQLKLVNKLREKLQGGEFDSAVFLGELGMSLRLIADTAKRVDRAYRALQHFDIYSAYREVFEGTHRKPKPRHDWRGRNRELRATAENVGSLWLEAKYGWVPLLKDAEEAAKSVAHALNVPMSTTMRVSRTVERTYKTSWNHVGNYGGYFTGHKEQRRGLIARIQEKESSLALISLGLMDPETVAWELLPYSFIADWFIPIGQYLEARALASKLVGTFITSDKKTAWAGPYMGTFGMTPAKGSTKYRQMVFSRTISSSLNVPMPKFKRLDQIATWSHAMTAVSLLITRGRLRRLPGLPGSQFLPALGH